MWEKSDNIDIDKFVKERYSFFANKHAESYQANAHSRYGFSKRFKLYTHILHNLIPPHLKERPISFLDSGCGNGCMAPLFKKHLSISTLDAIDITPGLVDLAKKSNEFARVECGNVLDLDSYFNGRYSIVNSGEIFLYIHPNKRPAFWKAHLNRIGSGGRMILMFPNFESAVRRIRPLKNGYFLNIESIRDDLNEFPDFIIESVSGISMLNDTVFNITNRLKRLLSFELGLVIKRRDEP